MSALRIVLLALPLFGLNACGSGGSGAEDSARSEISAAYTATPGVLDAIRSHGAVLHGGTRVFEVYDALGLSLAYRESVLTDGEGQFSQRPIEPLTPVGAAWLQEQELLEGFLFRYRDFAIRNRRLFLQNYRLEDLVQDKLVAGRPCSVYAVERRVGAKRYITIAVDDEKGLVLEYEEFDAEHRLTARMVYETFDAEPELDTAIWFQSLTDEVALKLDTDLATQVGRPFPMPRLLPRGFELAEAFTLNDGTHDWIKLTYSDGVDSLFYVYRDAGTEDAVSDTLVRQAGIRAANEGDLYLYRIGAAAAAHAVVDGGVFFVVGKVDDQSLVDLIESALP